MLSKVKKNWEGERKTERKSLNEEMTKILIKLANSLGVRSRRRWRNELQINWRYDESRFHFIKTIFY